MPEIKTPVRTRADRVIAADGEFVADCYVGYAAQVVSALNSHAALVQACKAALAERTNVGLQRPCWTPGVTEQLKAALAAGENDAHP